MSEEIVITDYAYSDDIIEILSTHNKLLSEIVKTLNLLVAYYVSNKITGRNTIDSN